MSAPPLLDHDLITRRVRVDKRDVVFVKGVFEASEGVGAMFAERGGELVFAAHASRARELDEILNDLAQELTAVFTDEA